jgi:hypothetical protein
MPVPSAPESLLGRVFDQYQNLMQIARCVREMARQRQVARLLNQDRMRIVGEIDFLNKDRARLSDQNARLTQELVHLRRHPWCALIERWSGSPR